MSAMKKDIRFVPTPALVIEGMLDLAKAVPGDHLYDLGCGDGRVVIAAAKRGLTAVGVDLDHRLVARAKENALAEGVSERVDFRVENFFDSKIREASVVTLYLRDHVNLKLLPHLLSELRPGTRIVSHSFDMGDWQPDESIMVETKLLFLWTMGNGP